LSGSKYFSITDFAKLTRTTRAALLHYDRLGLLSPIKRGDNNYRFYLHTQLGNLNMIRTCQVLGMTLAEIKSIELNRTPELINELLSEYIERLRIKINQYTQKYRFLQTIKSITQSALTVDIDCITIQYLCAEKIVLGKQNDYSNGRNVYDALLSFHLDSSDKYSDIDLNYIVWGMFSEERIKRRDWVWPDRYYYLDSEGNAEKPAELYAIGYHRGGYGQTGELYERILRYIDENGFEICGPAFEEYPLNEICIKNENEYLIRVMITVRKKQSV
jgi:DNA-binding transcriptional MerR regulator